jgi:hypothetical protein
MKCIVKGEPMKARASIQLVPGAPYQFHKRTLLVAVVVLAVMVPAIAQMGGGAAGELQQKVAAAKQSAAENKQKLHQYQWMETTQLTL